MLEGMEEYYSAELSEKVIRGLTENALKCKYNGGTLPIGYIIDSEQYFQIDPLTAPAVLDAFKHYAEGTSMREITDEMNLKGVRTKRGGKISINRYPYRVLIRSKQPGRGDSSRCRAVPRYTRYFGRRVNVIPCIRVYLCIQQGNDLCASTHQPYTPLYKSGVPLSSRSSVRYVRTVLFIMASLSAMVGMLP